MKLLEACLYKMCLLICLSSACYMTYLQFSYYVSNDDVASISYPKFNSDEKDEYPIFSICLRGFYIECFKIFDQSHDVFTTANITRESYYQYILGNQEDDFSQYSAIKFDDVALDVLQRYLLSSYGYSYTMGKLEDGSLSLMNSYQDSCHLCFSKNVSFTKGKMQQLDYLALNLSRMYENGIFATTYVHQKGQLMRSMIKKANPLSHIEPDAETKSGISRIFEITQVEVLRKRENSKMPCYKSLKDEDEYLLGQVITNTGCIPTFWENFAKNVGLNETTRICKSRKDYQELGLHHWNAFGSFSTLNNMYKQPCTEMRTSITAHDETGDKNMEGWKYRNGSTYGVLHVQFNYQEDVYREIINSRAYTGETLLGQVGGFAGKLR